MYEPGRVRPRKARTAPLLRLPGIMGNLIIFRFFAILRKGNGDSLFSDSIRFNWRSLTRHIAPPSA
jgi:hypothetical protein